MNGLQTFEVAPALPSQLLFLETLAKNLWWSWNSDAIELFRRIHRETWKESRHNPMVFLTRVPQSHLESFVKDHSFMAHLERVQKVFEADTQHPPDQRSTAYLPNDLIAYFSAEFGLHESVPLFAGGLGVLAGDHLKAASNIGLPMVAVGLLYRQGYFRQYLNNDGWQQETYPENEFQHLPLEKILTPKDNTHLRIKIALPEGVLTAFVWKIQVGRIPLFLLDANVPDNPPELRTITSQLYGGDQKTRLLQEILLGIGGVKALNAMGMDPAVCHMNEGHSAFISFERLARLINVYKLDKNTALQIIPRTSVFTTHTAVPAGHDEFPVEMITPYFDLLKDSIHSTAEEMLSWGRGPDAKADWGFSMTVFALHMAQYCNGVSKLHGLVARRMCSHLWPNKPEDEIPITHITNGVHTPSWLSPENVMLFDRYLGPNWRTEPGDLSVAARIEQIPDEELWRAHELSRSRLVRECRELMSRQLTHRNASKTEIERAKAVLSPEILTLGFARRFATYKRAGLLFRDAKRLVALLASHDRPIQLIFSGKAHPKDNGGKDLIKQLVHFARNHDVRNRVVFLEDYDIDIARFLVQGVDVWLNTPRRPLEASGTSGMKAAVNGALNVSILDGWWCEGYAPGNGWSIGNGEEYQDSEYQDNVESQALYNLLENDVIPLYYTRPNDRIPIEWVRMMKRSIKTAFSQFSSHRMVREYEQRFYIPALTRSRELMADSGKEWKHIQKQHDRLAKYWSRVNILHPKAETDLFSLRVGQTFKVTALAHLGELTPDDVCVELYYGLLGSASKIGVSCRHPMTLREEKSGGNYLFECDIHCQTTGRYGFTARIIPHGDDWLQNSPGLIAWAK
ncbi:MAG: alpha-glucan family phosphorylase [Lentisphaerae bacterium]|nr:alpha-glucan family phosphorylase [Lentisphaerota bacterium]